MPSRETTQACPTDAWDALPAGFLIADSDGSIRRANPAFFKLTRTEPIVCPSTKTVSELLAVWGVDFRDFSVQEYGFPPEPTAVAGTWIRLRRIFQHDSHGRVACQLFFAEDISDLKQIEKNLIDTEISLGEALREARQQTNEARELNRAKSEFLAMMTHELRTPLTGIIGMSDLAYETKDPVKQQEFLRIVKFSANALFDIVNDILDLSKIEAGKFDLLHEPFDLHLCVGEAIKLLASRAQGKGVELYCQIDPHTPAHLIGDAGRLRQVVLNLVNNSIKFTDKGEVAVFVEMKDKTDTDAMLHFVVHDTGIGIAADKLQTVFEAFGQADSTIYRKYGGTGLGVPISAEIIRMMGGKMTIESEHGHGTRIDFTLRVDLDKTITEPRDTFPSDLRILVVDDVEPVRDSLIAILKSKRISTGAVSSGEGAIEAVRQAEKSGRPYHILLLDIGLPGMDGYEVARRISNVPEWNSLKIVLFTAADMSKVMAAAKGIRNITQYLMKPVYHQELFDAIQHCIDISEKKEPDADDAATENDFSRLAVQPLRILLAEDNETNQIVLRHQLEPAGHQVTVVDNGIEALEALDRHDYDLVLMDVHMPLMDGLEATRLLRQFERGTGKHIPIIALTAMATSSNQRECEEAGMVDYLTKPVRRNKLYELLWKYAPPDNRQNAPSSTSEPAPAPAQLTKTSAFTDSSRDKLNTHALLGEIGNDRVVLNRLAKVAMEEIPHYCARIQSAHAAGDRASMQMTAHTLKTTLKHWGAHTAADLANDIEKACNNGDMGQAFAVFSSLEKHVETIMSQLREIQTLS